MSFWDRLRRAIDAKRVRQRWRQAFEQRRGPARGDSGLDGFPLVTTGLLAACALLYFVTLQLSADFGGEGGFEPSPQALVRAGANFTALVQAGEWWRPITSMFLHGDGLHILMNGIGLWTVGLVAEERFGRARAFVAFVLCGALGQTASIVWYQNVLGIGASGAIFGLIGLCVVHALRHNDTELRARFVPWLIYGLIVGFASRGIDNAAHIGGLATGGVLGLMLGDETEARRLPSWLWNALALLVLAVVAAAFYLAAQSPALE